MYRYSACFTFSKPWTCMSRSSRAASPSGLRTSNATSLATRTSTSTIAAPLRVVLLLVLLLLLLLLPPVLLHKFPRYPKIVPHNSTQTGVKIMRKNNRKGSSTSCRNGSSNSNSNSHGHGKKDSHSNCRCNGSSIICVTGMSNTGTQGLWLPASSRCFARRVLS